MPIRGLKDNTIKTSIAALNAALAHRPDYPRLYWRLACVQARLGHEAEARAALESLAALGVSCAFWSVEQVREGKRTKTTVERELEYLRREAEGLSQRRHEFVVEGDRSLDLRGSQQYLHSAFSNLVSNAVRYTPQGGRITIRWQRDGDGARFSVTDTGYGIPPEHLPRIAERFYRVSTSRSRATGGTGLGLSIVKHVLNLHQARLEVASEVGTGSTFSCVFEAERLLERHEGEAA